MMRRAGFFNPLRQLATQNITVKQPPATTATNNQSLTSMTVEIKYIVKDHEPPHTLVAEYVVPHDRISSFAKLLSTVETLAKKSYESAAMVVIANKDVIPPTQKAIDQLNDQFGSFQGLTPYIFFTLQNLLRERLETAEKVNSTPSLLTRFY